jgi:hypothetical protein
MYIYKQKYKQLKTYILVTMAQRRSKRVDDHQQEQGEDEEARGTQFAGMLDPCARMSGESEPCALTTEMKKARRFFRLA